jgi:methionyl-tRNA formyltransferase
LELLELQPAGKRRMSGEEFLRGLREQPRNAS